MGCGDRACPPRPLHQGQRGGEVAFHRPASVAALDRRNSLPLEQAVGARPHRPLVLRPAPHLQRGALPRRDFLRFRQARGDMDALPHPLLRLPRLQGDPHTGADIRPRGPVALGVDGLRGQVASRAARAAARPVHGHCDRRAGAAPRVFRGDARRRAGEQPAAKERLPASLRVARGPRGLGGYSGPSFCSLRRQLRRNGPATAAPGGS